MKIGILTYHWVYNFGANLQTLSTIENLKKQGHSPIVINWIPIDREIEYNNHTLPAQINVFKQFQKDYYPMTKVCRNAFDIANVIKEEHIEGVFLGADTLFTLSKPRFSLRKLKYLYPTSPSIFPNPFWGEFLNYVDVPIVGYSISSVDVKYKDFSNQKEEINKYLLRFKSLTVRDKRTHDMVSFFTNGILNPQITPDPVFNFNANVDFASYEEEVLCKYDLKKKYVLLCILEEYAPKFQTWSQELKIEVEKTGRRLIELPRQTGRRCFPIDQLNNNVLNPLEWYIIIKNADAFIGSLMHCVVTCIHNEVPFYSLDYYGVRRMRDVYVNYKTSKTFQIMKDCGLIKYYANIAARFCKIPSVKEVVDALNNYDIDLLHEASVRKRQESSTTMNAAVNNLEKYVKC